MANITLIEFVELLKNNNTPTPKTIEFDREYGQSTDRWWDSKEINGISTQKIHVITHFACWYFKEGGPSKCNERKCMECYSKKIPDLSSFTDENEKSVAWIFNRMKRPEMFIYVAEALEILDEEQLTNYISETINAINENQSWTEVRHKYLKWSDVEEKFLNMD